MHRLELRSVAVFLAAVALGCATNDKRASNRGPGDDPNAGKSGAAGDFGNSDGDLPGDLLPTGAGPSCARVDVGATRVIPTVWLVVDGSGSMTEPYSLGTRWSVLHDHLANPDTGLVKEMQGAVRFGLSVYQAPPGDPSALFAAFLAQAMALSMPDAGPPPPPPMVEPDPNCPTLTGPDPVLDNFDAIAAAYLGVTPNGDTPTGEALLKVAAKIAEHAPAPDDDVGPQVIILATDGQPNGCVPPDVFGSFMACAPDPKIPFPDPVCLQNALGAYGYQQSLDAAHTAHDAGAELYVISLAQGLKDQEELHKIANVGIGLPEGETPGAEIFEPLDAAALRQTLRNLVGGKVGCQVKLEGKLSVNKACDTFGLVELNGERLPCDDPDGWRVIDERHIQLTGEACNTWLGAPSAMVHARFPCDVIRPI